MPRNERNNVKPGSFRYKKNQLKMWYKLLKARMIKPEDVPTKFRGLMIKYYGVPPELWSKHEPKSAK